ncbi:MAG: hypothetical protein EXS17_02445 [Phycisphaerales bacterium]|nr:hypothetical protein [Phycisphaerales bacterium]
MSAAADGFVALRTSVLFSLLIWLGCVAVPMLGGVAWVFLMLATGWRAIGSYRLAQEKFIDQFEQPTYLRSFTPLVHAELAVGCAVAFLTLASSMSNFPIVAVVLLALGQVAWLLLISVNNFLTLEIARVVGRMCGTEPTTPLIRFAPLVIFGAPALFLPLLCIRLLNTLLPTPLPDEIGAGAALIVAVGCIAGAASVLLIQAELTNAHDALCESHRAPRVTPVHHPPVRRMARQDEPPAPGSGDVIPFEDDPPSSSGR